MMRRMRRGICICVILLGCMLLCNATSASGIALAPSVLEITDAVRGEEYERSVTVINPEDVEQAVTIGTEEEAGDWIELFLPDDRTTPVNEVTVPALDRVTLNARITIPEDAANGIYNAKIYVITKSTKIGGQTGVSAAFRASTIISLSVTDVEIHSGSIDSVKILDTEMSFVLPIEVNFQNTGNVVEKPEVTVAILKDGKRIDRITHSDTPVRANTIGTIQIEWDTAGREVGEYTAQVSAALDGKSVGEEEVEFEILPLGTMTRNGMLTGLSYEGNAVPKGILKVVGTFLNNGQIETKAKLVGEVNKDGTLVDIIDGDEFSVPVNEKEELVSYIDIGYAGEYEISAYVLYEGKKTDKKTFTVSAIDPAAQVSPLSPVPALAALGILALLLYRRAGKREL
jgi:hypothetical protein